MKGDFSVFLILKKEKLNKFMTKMEIDAPLIAKKAKAGQFIILRVNETGERIPLTIADYDRTRGIVTIIYQVVGKTTAILDSLNEGDYILDFVGPLGKPTVTKGYKDIAVIGGGTGCAIAYPQAKSLFEEGKNVDIIAGFKNKELIILEKEMKEKSNNTVIITDDGSNGKKGFVTDAFRENIESGKAYDLVIAIGPLPMMRAVCALTKEHKIKTIVSMNPIMIDGTGMCGGCRLKVGGEMKFACVDGPDFDGHKVDFDEAILRLGLFKDKERKSMQEYECNLLKQRSED